MHCSEARWPVFIRSLWKMLCCIDFFLLPFLWWPKFTRAVLLHINSAPNLHGSELHPVSHLTPPVNRKAHDLKFWISSPPLSRSKGNKCKAPEHPLSFRVPGVLRCRWDACAHQWPMDALSLAGAQPAPSLCSQWLQSAAPAAWRVLPDPPWELLLLSKHPCTSRGLSA